MHYRPASSHYDTFLKYRATIIHAVALAWKDPAFDRALCENPKEALKETLHYDFPYDMDLSIIRASATFNAQLNMDWISHTQNVVSLTLPPCPEPGQEAIALAQYNASFPTFLTTV